MTNFIFQVASYIVGERLDICDNLSYGYTLDTTFLEVLDNYGIEHNDHTMMSSIHNDHIL